MPERFNLPDTPVPEDALLNEIMTRCHHTLVSYAHNYANQTRDAMFEAEDYYQHISMLLLEYVTKKREEAQAAVASRDDHHLERFVSLLCNRRMGDLWETTTAYKREARRTVNASGFPARLSDQPGISSYLEIVACDQGPRLDPDSAGRVTNYCEGLQPLARRVVETLLQPPQKLRKAFLAARTKLSYGVVEIAAARRSYGLSRMDLRPREGYGSLFWQVTWEGPLRKGVTQTSHGDMTVSDETDLWRIDFGFPLMVLTDGHVGEFEHKTVRPTRASFDLKALAHYLSTESGKLIPDCQVRRAWTEAMARYTTLFGGGAGDDPEPAPGRQAAVA